MTNYEEKKMPTQQDRVDISTLITIELPTVNKETIKLRALLGQPIALPSLRFPLPRLTVPWLAEALEAEQGGRDEQ
jgi:hypothetical protein